VVLPDTLLYFYVYGMMKHVHLTIFGYGHVRSLHLNFS